MAIGLDSTAFFDPNDPLVELATVRPKDGLGADLAVHVRRAAPEAVVDFGNASFNASDVYFLAPASEWPTPRVDDRITIGAQAWLVKARPRHHDRYGQIWRLAAYEDSGL